jgi:hypothetical protein
MIVKLAAVLVLGAPPLAVLVCACKAQCSSVGSRTGAPV